jgi:hypothetical protein
MTKENTIGFFKNHADTLAIIGVNLAIATLILSMWISNTHRIDAANARTDSLISSWINDSQAWHQESRDFHGRLCAIEERNKKG